MKIKEFENFNPEAELHVRVNEHIMEINDISWFDAYDRERSLESIKRSKAETTDVYLDSCTKMLASNGFNEVPVLDSDKIVLSAKFRVNKIIKPNCNLAKELKIKEGDWLVIDFELVNKAHWGRTYAHYVDIYNVQSGLRKINTSLNVLASTLKNSFEIQRLS